MKTALVALSALALSGCMGKVVMDPSISPASAGDFTLVLTAGTDAVASGLSALRVKEEAPVDASMQFVLPTGKKITGGELHLDYRDVSKSYAITKESGVISVPYSDLISHPAWQKADEGTILVRAKVEYDSGQGQAVLNMSGLVFVIVHQKGYDPMPLDSGYVAFKTNCTVVYSTVGRSAVSCK
jgi:hypothetical protein